MKQRIHAYMRHTCTWPSAAHAHRQSTHPSYYLAVMCNGGSETEAKPETVWHGKVLWHQRCPNPACNVLRYCNIPLWNAMCSMLVCSITGCGCHMKSSRQGPYSIMPVREVQHTPRATPHT
eukprot:3049191-Pyramimonas_sp.AAC.2